MNQYILMNSDDESSEHSDFWDSGTDAEEGDENEENKRESEEEEEEEEKPKINKKELKKNLQSQLKKLKVKGYSLKKEDLKLISTTLQPSQLEDLLLSHVDLQPKTFPFVCQILQKQSQSLTNLDLSNNKLISYDLLSILKVDILSNIRRLVLNRTFVHVRLKVKILDGIIHLLQNENCTLKELELQHNHLCEKHVRKLFLNGLTHPNNKLTSLKLDKNLFELEDVYKLSKTFPSMSRLSFLSFAEVTYLNVVEDRNSIWKQLMLSSIIELQVFHPLDQSLCEGYEPGKGQWPFDIINDACSFKQSHWYRLAQCFLSVKLIRGHETKSYLKLLPLELIRRLLVSTYSRSS